MANNGINIGLKSYDDLFKDDIGRRTEEIKPTPISELKPFSDQPFKVVDDDNMPVGVVHIHDILKAGVV